MINDIWYGGGILVELGGLATADIAFTNNTIVGGYSHIGIGIALTSSSYDAIISGNITNNLMTNTQCGISRGDYVGYTVESYNAFYQCTYPLDDSEGEGDIFLEYFPFDYEHSELGSYFLNNDEEAGAELIEGGHGNVTAYYDDPYQWSIFSISDEGTHLFTGDEFDLQENVLWQPNYQTCDEDIVAIGYHHPRVDYINFCDLLDLNGHDVTIAPGTIVAMGYGELYNGYLCNEDSSSGTNGSIFCIGGVSEEEKIKFVYGELASMYLHSYYLASGRPRIYFTGNIESTNDSVFCFTDFVGVGLTINGNETSQLDFTNPIHDCLFKFSSCGSYLLNTNIEFLNCIFEYCESKGIDCHGGEIQLENCNFDQNYCGIETSGTNTNLTTKNCIFTNNEIYGIAVEGGTITEEYNAFLGNRTHILNKTLDSTDLANPELVLADFLQNWEEFEDRFYLPQTSDLVDGGDPADGPMWGYTTDPARTILDDGIHIPRDIGYHYLTAIGNPWEEITCIYDTSQFLQGTTVTIYNQAGDGQPGFAVLPLVYLNSGYEINYHSFSVTFSGSGTCKAALGHSSINDYDDIDGAASQSKYYLHTTPIQVNSGQVVNIISPYKNEHYAWLYIYTDGTISISSISYAYLKGTATLYGHMAKNYKFAGRNLPFRIMFPKNYGNL
ncbi:MAG: hypothetical protein A2Y10_14680 [Planctomycetes bacterium GWF2_41_51]|nr:MAG: hypothetical protein A2Y10_14680 [Planctomycetes bacterium GWF2_41_51]HBG25798.1 hypothetical protein [Phycisphaerales bacterium]